jgi:monofunctional glycosyltransferase
VKKIALAVLALVVGGVAYVWLGLPSRADVSVLARENPGQTSVMRQREAEARRQGRAYRVLHSWVPMSRISRHLVHAVLSAEDQKFFGHEGVDWDAIKESVEVNRAEKRFARGGSTITQQLAKNLFFTTHKSLTRKGRELLVARWLEEDLSKRRILELYLNVIEWGNGVFGCQAAAQRYYGKACSDLRPEEAAGLAAMIPNPRRINPAVNAARHGGAQRRVLWLMAHAGYLGKQGLGAEPPPVEVDEPDEDEVEEEPAPETTPTPEATPAPEASPTAPPEPPPETEPTPTPTPTRTPTPGAPS